MRFGYARVSTGDQRTGGQIDRLAAADCDEMFVDHGVSGTQQSRPQLDRMLGRLRGGDEVVVYSLSRLGRSTRHLLEMIEGFDSAGVALVSLTESIDTSTPAGRLVLTILAAVSEMEREMIVARTREGLEAARKRGRVGGRPTVLDDGKIDAIRRLREMGASLREIAAVVGVSRSTVHRAVIRPR